MCSIPFYCIALRESCFVHHYYYYYGSLNSFSPAGMNAAVRAVVRMGLYVGAKVYFIKEVSHHNKKNL